MAELNFDATQVEPGSAFEVLPKGDYPAIMIDSEFKDTKAGNGQYLQVCWEVIDGQYKGQRLFDRLNLRNTNETAVKIAQGSLSAICHSVGILKPKDSCELHNKPCLIKVIAETRKDKPEEFANVIKGYEAIRSNTATPATPATAAGTSETPPWKRKKT